MRLWRGGFSRTMPLVLADFNIRSRGFKGERDAGWVLGCIGWFKDFGCFKIRAAQLNYGFRVCPIPARI